LDKHTRELYNDQIYQEALSRFGIHPDGMRELDGFESFIYEYEKDTISNILRISHSLHHPPNRTRGEMDFLRYLSRNGLAVPQPQPSQSGNLVEVIEASDGSVFSAVSFDKAPGSPPGKEDWNPDLFYRMGLFMGRLHSLSREYKPSHPDYRRHEWYEDEEDYATRYLPPGEAPIIEKFAQLVAYLKALPRDPQGYGLIHLDFHGGNFFIEKKDKLQITLFDFDDCAYAPFVYDIAMALFYAVPHHCDTPASLEFARTFYRTFLNGYYQENQLDPVWLKEIPYFLKLREMDLYIIIHRSFDLESLGPWEASFMAGRKECLENDVPYIDMEFDYELE
jgi:Ser/Thr protein kinase RdoA (MazF antagonist)